jgi:hypothetical protein
MAGRWLTGFGRLSVDEKESAEDRITALQERLREAQTRAEDEQQKRFEAEDWADGLIDG